MLVSGVTVVVLGEKALLLDMMVMVVEFVTLSVTIDELVMMEKAELKVLVVGGYDVILQVEFMPVE